MSVLGTKTCEEFWRELLADENSHNKKLLVRLRVSGWTNVRGLDFVSLTGGGIWGPGKSSDPIGLFGLDCKNILSESVRSLYNDEGAIVELEFDLQRLNLNIFVDGHYHRVYPLAPKRLSPIRQY